MSNEQVRDLLPAIDIAAFERRRDGSFAPVAPLPAWFGRLVADGTFPFLGHILEEANQFWAARAPARREWGPCAEVDEAGHEFHYRVSATNGDTAQYLVFRLDTGSDEMRQVLQKVRQQMLAEEQGRNAVEGAEAAHVDVRRAAEELRAMVTTLVGATTTESRQELASTVSAKCDDLVRTIDRLIAGNRTPT
jgi:hypothetical protein